MSGSVVQKVGSLTATWATGATAAAWAASAAVTAAVICACRAAAASASAILKETKNCGLELVKAAAAAENGKRKTKELSNPSAKWLHCGWSATRQQHSETYEANEGFSFHHWLVTTVAGVNSTTTQH